MAEMTIMLRRDPNTGKQNIIIKLDSEPDALPHEHEQMHKKLVQEVTGLKPEDLGEVIIVREPEAQSNEPTSSPNEQERKKEGSKG
ncbi:MAG TPA: hypothetical protein VG122_07255 [Gemmata sp.]|jgi:hypothetical protein|nr:hypothetical protein [Gemmata sp.]